MRNNIMEILADAEKIAKTASKHNHSLTGSGFYPMKYSELYAEATVAYKKLSLQLNKLNDKAIKDALTQI